MADKSSTGAVHLTTLDLDVAKIYEQLNSIDQRIRETAELARSTPIVIGGGQGGTGGGAESSFATTRKSIEQLIGQYLALEKTITQFRATGNSEVFREISTGVTSAKEALTSFSQTLKDGGKLTKEEKKTISELAEQLTVFRNRVQEADNSLLKSGESMDQQKNKVASLVEKYNSLLTAISKSPLDTSNTNFQKLQAEASKSAESVKALYESIKNGTGVTEEQAKQFSSLGRSLSDYRVTLSNLETTARRTGEGLRETTKSAPDYSKYITSIENLNLQYKNFQNTLSKSTLKGNFGKQVDDVRGRTNELARQVEELNRAVQQNGTVTEAQASKYNSLKSSLTGLKGQFKDIQTGANNATSGITNMLNRFADKAKWMIAFQFVTLIRNAFLNLVDVMKDAETAVVELQRVMNDYSRSQADMSDELFQIAYDYGQSVENVQETAVKFAQTGLGWEDVLEATRVTMLALNSAELETSTATEGLIAVMNQFGYTAKDLEGIIDKINITSDKFPVTSEKIVAALQRAGSTAAAYGMTLEQTIATITALGSATGRTGETIGTALNSLITFSMKAGSLEKFEEFLNLSSGTLSGQSPLAIWTALADAIDDGGEALGAMMASSEEFQELFSEEMAEALGLQDEYNNALAAGQDIYSAVGTYRQNYFIALLKNIQIAIDALGYMDNTLGYTAEKNEHAMETLGKKMNQLVVTAKQLAVEFGNTGGLALAKWAVDSATAILKLTQALGGLRTVFLTLTTALVIVKKAAIATFILNVTNGIANLSGGFKKLLASMNPVLVFQKAYIASLRETAIAAAEAAAAENAEAAAAIRAKAASVALANGLSALLGPFMILATVLSAGIGLWNSYRERMEEARLETIQMRKELIEAGKEAETTGISLAKAVKELEDAKLSGVSEDIKSATISLIEFFGYSEEDIPKLMKQYEDLGSATEQLDAVLKNLIETKYEDLKVEALKRQQAAYARVDEIVSPGVAYIPHLEDDTNKAVKAINALVEAGYDAEISIDKFGKSATMSFGEIPESVEEAKEVIEDLDKRIETIKANLTSNELVDNVVLDYIIAWRDTLKDVFGEMESADEAAKKYTGDVSNYLEIMNETLETTQSALDEYAKSGALIDLSKDIESLGELFDDLSDKVDDFQSAYSSLIDVIEEYNETGIMTADMLQTILELEPEYIEMLNVQGDSLSLNKDAVNGLINVNDIYLQQLAALKISKAADQIATEMQTAAANGLTAAEYTAAYAADVLGGDVYDAALKMIQGTGSADDFANALANVANSAKLTGDWIEIFTGKVVNFANQISSLLNLTKPSNIKTYYTPKSSTSSASKSSSASTKSPAEIALENEKNAIDDLIDSYENEIYFMEKVGASADDLVSKYLEMQAAVHIQADRYRAMGYDDNEDFLRELGKKWWELQEEIEDIISGIYETSVDAYQNAIDALEHEYDHLSASLDYSGMNENLKKQIEYQLKIQEAANQEFERLLKKGVDVNDDAVQAVVKTWRSACDKINDLNEELAENILDTYESFMSLADSFDVWDRLDISKVEMLEQELKEINKLYEEGIISLSKYKDLLEDVGKSYLDARLDELEAKQDEVQKYYDDIIDGYNKEIDELKKRKDASDKYYDGLIDQLKEVQESNERINAQLDYYAERQKILRNLEQAQARSGVEWREKEIEYQEQLADLDEDWRRTQEDWRLTDQVEALEKLKQEAADNFEAAIARLEEYIDSAEKEAEDAIAAISAEMEDLKEKIYRAITEEIATAKKNADELKESMSGIADDAIPSIENLSELIEKSINESINTVSINLVDKISAAGEKASKALADSFAKNFVDPVSSQVSNIMKSATSPTAVSKATTSSISSSSSSTSTATKPTVSYGDDNSLAAQIRKDNAALGNTGTTSSGTVNNTVNLYADIKSGATTGALNTLMSKMQDFFSQPFRS